jgi:hypothetical protein
MRARERSVGRRNGTAMQSASMSPPALVSGTTIWPNSCGTAPTTWTFSSDSTTFGAKSRVGESWLPAMTTISIAGRRRCASAQNRYQRRCAAADGLATSKTSPAIKSASTSNSSNRSSSHSRKRSCSYSRDTSCSVCPRCQSAV